MTWKGMRTMPSISKIRLANIIYEEGNKRYNDELFLFDGHNGAILLENGGGKTVLIQTALQAMIPHTELADRKIGKTLALESGPAHIAIEWIIHDKPRRYVVTAVTLFMSKHGVDSLRYVYEYAHGDKHSIEELPFIRDVQGGKRPSERGEMQDYYSMMKDQSLSAATFATIKEYRTFIEENYQIIASEWESIVKINSSEGGVEAFFESCKTTNQLFDRLLIPTVESAMIGHDDKQFARLFEQRYEHFKKHQELTETLKENKQIEDELDKYTKAFEKLHLKEQELLTVKQHTKGLWEQIKHEKQLFRDEKEQLIEKETTLKEEEVYQKVKRASHRIAEWQEKKDRAEEALRQVTSRREEQASHTENLKEQYASIRYAKFANEKRKAEETLAVIKQKIDTFEQEEDTEEVISQLTEVKQAIHGAYQMQLEGLSKAIEELRHEQRPLESQLAQFEQQLRTYEENHKTLEHQKIRLHSLIENREKDSEQLRQLLLANPQQEKIEELLPTWERTSQALDEEIVHLKTERKRLKREQEAMEQERKEIEAANKEVALQSQRVTQQLETAQEEEQHVIQELATLKNEWHDIDRIHLQQQTIEAQFEATIEKLYVDFKKKLHEERLALRYVDDYGEQDTFFSDPYLKEQLANWKNQLDYVETGVDFLNGLSEDAKNKLRESVLWSNIIVTTEKEKHRLVKRLEQVSDRMAYPIMVVTTEEASMLTEINHGTWIVPEHWTHNVDKAQFTEWKARLTSQAETITQERVRIDKTVKRWEQAFVQFRQFIEKYPFALIEEWQSKQYEADREKERLDRELERIDKQWKDVQHTMDTSTQRAEEAEREQVAVNDKIIKGHDYRGYQRDIAKHHEEIATCLKEMDDLSQSIRQLRRSMDRYQRDIDERTERIRDLESQQALIRENRDYKRVVELDPIFTEETLEVLEMKWEDLQLQKERITRQIGELEAKRETEREKIRSATDRLEDIEIEYPSVNKSATFPADGEQYIKRLYLQLQDATEELEKVKTTHQEAEKDYEIQGALLTKEQKDFTEKYPDKDVVLFDGALSEAAQQLDTEDAALMNRRKYIEQEFSRVDKELQSIDTAERVLEKFIEGYHFNAPGIASIPLNEQEAKDFQYARKSHAMKWTDTLKEKKSVVDEERDKLNIAKDAFRIFCRNHITDKKLQQMAIQGIEQKRVYHDVMIFKQNIAGKIQQITKIANENIRKEDEELQIFINQMHTHLQTLVEELEQIPKKTRVKVENWKTIFTFTIPRWEQEDGVLRIRNYVEWITQQLKSEKYHNAEGQEDTSKMRVDLEKWLDSKQLLKVVMDRDVMKVHCLKVTNDNKVTTRSYSWEQSNVWSGGEKWSKNMTLFLGILKYVAEKRKANAANRVVILDNPFGKASSDHVLSPVFFIAEQLGFQMIALTAHAEGKFLQDYFPIIYSCRLRTSKDANKKVMATSKWLHHAYFQDHEPSVIDRLGQTEQMDMFSL